MAKGPSTANGPITNPVSEFKHVPEPTRALIEELDQDDREALRFICSLSKQDRSHLADLLRSYNNAKVLGWGAKWLFFSILGAFMAAIAFGEKVVIFFSWVRGR